MLRKITSAANVHAFLGSNELQGFLGDYTFMQPETIDELDAAFLKFLPQLLNVALREITEEQAEKEPQLAVTYPKNATACLTFFCRRLNGIVEAVPIVFATLARKGTLHPVIATNITDIMTTARMAKEGAVADRVRIALNAEVMHGAIRQLAQSTTIAEMLLNLFDPVDTFFMDTDSTASGNNSEAGKLAARSLFTQHWIQHDFPMSLVRCIPIAMSSEDNLPYFFFLSEMVMKAEKTVVGSLVDVLMSEEAVDLLFEAVLDAARSPNALENFPFIGEGIRLLHTYVSMGLALVEDLTIEDGGKSDRAVAATNATLKKFQKIGPVLLQIISGEFEKEAAAAANGEGKNENGAPKRKRLGELRYRTIRLLTTRIESRTLRTVDFLPPLIRTFVQVAEEFPSSDLVLSVMDSMMGCLSTYSKEETVAVIQSLNGFNGGDQMVSVAPSPARVDQGPESPTLVHKTESTAVLGGEGSSDDLTLIEKFYQWRTEDQYAGTSLYAHAGYYLKQFQTVLPPGLVAEVSTTAAETLSKVEEELDTFNSVITGDSYTVASPTSPFGTYPTTGVARKSSASLISSADGGVIPWDVDLEPVVHKEMLNPNGVDLTDLAERESEAVHNHSTDDKAASLMNSSTSSDSSSASSRSSRYSAVDTGEEEDDSEGIEGFSDGDIGGLLVDGKDFGWADDDDDQDIELQGNSAAEEAAAAEDEWEFANTAFETTQQQSSTGAQDGNIRPSSAGDAPTPSADSPQKDTAGSGSGARYATGTADSYDGAPGSAGSDGRPMSGFGAGSGMLGDDEDDGVMMMTPPQTPDSNPNHPGSAGSDGGLAGPVQWRPGSSGMDGLLPPNSAGSIGEGDLTGTQPAAGEEDHGPAGEVDDEDDDI